MLTFRDFLLEEMRKRDMNVSAFARFLGITHTAVNRFLDGTTEPAPRTLAVMSEKLNVPIETLFSIAYPNIDNAVFKDDPEALMLAKQISELPPDKRELIISAIVGMLANQSPQ